MHNFTTGSGKSPSFFFFTDDRALMIKTVKESEKKILFETDFLFDYEKHIKENKHSLLSKILGVYEIKVSNATPMVFLITENMIGDDFSNIEKAYDLKGSIHARETIVDPDFDTGFIVLKDKNFLKEYKKD